MQLIENLVSIPVTFTTIDKIYPFFLCRRENEEFLLQVDSAQMEHIFSTLVDHLQIQEAYNIFVLNPKPIGKRINYGYR